MKKILLICFVVFGFYGVNAQTLDSYIDSELPTTGTGAITALDLRNVLKRVVDSLQYTDTIRARSTRIYFADSAQTEIVFADAGGVLTLGLATDTIRMNAVQYIYATRPANSEGTDVLMIDGGGVLSRYAKANFINTGNLYQFTSQSLTNGASNLINHALNATVIEVYVVVSGTPSTADFSIVDDNNCNINWTGTTGSYTIYIKTYE